MKYTHLNLAQKIKQVPSLKLQIFTYRMHSRLLWTKVEYLVSVIVHYMIRNYLCPYTYRVGESVSLCTLKTYLLNPSLKNFNFHGFLLGWVYTSLKTRSSLWYFLWVENLVRECCALQNSLIMNETLAILTRNKQK